MDPYDVEAPDPNLKDVFQEWADEEKLTRYRPLNIKTYPASSKKTSPGKQSFLDRMKSKCTKRLIFTKSYIKSLKKKPASANKEENVASSSRKRRMSRLDSGFGDAFPVTIEDSSESEAEKESVLNLFKELKEPEAKQRKLMTVASSTRKTEVAAKKSSKKEEDSQMDGKEKQHKKFMRTPTPGKKKRLKNFNWDSPLAVKFVARSPSIKNKPRNRLSGKSATRLLGALTTSSQIIESFPSPEEKRKSADLDGDIEDTTVADLVGDIGTTNAADQVGDFKVTIAGDQVGDNKVTTVPDLVKNTTTTSDEDPGEKITATADEHLEKCIAASTVGDKGKDVKATTDEDLRDITTATTASGLVEDIYFASDAGHNSTAPEKAESVKSEVTKMLQESGDVLQIVQDDEAHSTPVSTVSSRHTRSTAAKSNTKEFKTRLESPLTTKTRNSPLSRESNLLKSDTNPASSTKLMPSPSTVWFSDADVTTTEPAHTTKLHKMILDWSDEEEGGMSTSATEQLSKLQQDVQEKEVNITPMNSPSLKRSVTSRSERRKSTMAIRRQEQERYLDWRRSLPRNFEDLEDDNEYSDDDICSSEEENEDNKKPASSEDDIKAAATEDDIIPTSMETDKEKSADVIHLPSSKATAEEEKDIFGDLEAFTPTKPVQGHQVQLSVEQSGLPGDQDSHAGGKSSHPEVLSGHPVDQSVHPVEQSGHPVEQSGHPVDQCGHPVDQSGHPVDQSGHPVCQSVHSVDQAVHLVYQTGHLVDQASHPVDQSSHPVDRDSSFDIFLLSSGSKAGHPVDRDGSFDLFLPSSGSEDGQPPLHSWDDPSADSSDLIQDMFLPN